MANKRVFISFDYDNDRHYKNLLLAWNENDDFDFNFYDGSLTAAINSTNATYVKSKIRPLIEKATHLLCVIGENCAYNEWIAWEIETAAECGNKLVGVKIDKSCQSPEALKNNGATWALSFNFEAIKKALDEA